jgi:hypothetical protein
MDSVDPKREKPRNEKADPKRAKSMTDNEEPNLAIP